MSPEGYAKYMRLLAKLNAKYGKELAERKRRETEVSDDSKDNESDNE